MVGYHKHDSLTHTQKLVAGCSAGVITRFITQPLDIIKLRTQATKRQKTAYKTIRRIFLEEGMKAFWHGHVLGQIHSVLAVSSQFFMYELTTQYFSTFSWGNHYRQQLRFCCGVFAGMCSATLVIPLEVIRVRQMLIKDQYSSLLKGARLVYKYGGLFAFYEGLSASLLQMGPQVGLSFIVFSNVQPRLLHMFHPNVPKCTPENCRANRYTAQQLLVSSSLAGALAGIISKAFTYPLDLTKRRLQIASHRTSRKYVIPSTSKNLIHCNSIIDCLAKTIRKEGFRGIFRGLSITVWKAQLTSIVAFTSYELICYSLREINNTALK